MNRGTNPNSNILKFRIMSVSSEHKDYPTSNLLVPKKGNKGWQSDRFCVYPQEIILGFPQVCNISSMQLLSHQSKIPTKIDILVSNPAPDQVFKSMDNLTFKKIGYFMLSSNEASNFQSRELKTVYIDSKAVFLKLVLHKPHSNGINLFSQVNIIRLGLSLEYFLEHKFRGAGSWRNWE